MCHFPFFHPLRYFPFYLFFLCIYFLPWAFSLKILLIHFFSPLSFWPFLSFLFPPYLYFPTSRLRLMIPSCLYWTKRRWSFILADLPLCFCVSVSWSSGHVNRISLFHAQSHPVITDPGVVQRVCVCVQREASIDWRISGQTKVCISLTCVLARGRLVCNLISHFWGEGMLLNELYSIPVVDVRRETSLI